MSGGKVFWLRLPLFRAVIVESENIQLVAVRGNYSVGDILDIGGAEAVVIGEYPAKALSVKNESVIRNAKKIDYDYSRVAEILKSYVANPTIKQMMDAPEYADGIFFLRREGEIRELQYAFAVPSVNNAAENEDQLWGIDVMFSKRRFGDNIGYIEQLTSEPYYVYGFLKDFRLHAVTVVPTADLNADVAFKTAKQLLEEESNELDQEGNGENN